jgi:SRSO17 transposase
VPETVAFATTPELAERMLARALDAGVEAAWVVADAVYGDSRRLGMMLEKRAQPSVLALSGTAHVWVGLQQQRVGDVLAGLRDTPGDGWQRRSAGDGAKGPRRYDWLRLPLHAPLQDGFARWLLVRRSLDDPHALSAYAVFAPTGTTLEELVRVAGRRWRVEMGFEEAKGEVGLDQDEVRSWHGWYRHITLALVAHAVLAVMRSTGQEIEAAKRGRAVRQARTVCGHSSRSAGCRGADSRRGAAAGAASAAGPAPVVGRGAPLVGLAPPPLGGRPTLSRPETERGAPMNYNCSTRAC